MSILIRWFRQLASVGWRRAVAPPDTRRSPYASPVAIAQRLPASPRRGIRLAHSTAAVVAGSQLVTVPLCGSAAGFISDHPGDLSGNACCSTCGDSNAVHNERPAAASGLGGDDTNGPPFPAEALSSSSGCRSPFISAVLSAVSRFIPQGGRACILEKNDRRIFASWLSRMFTGW